jgi:choline dehydrogenase
VALSPVNQRRGRRWSVADGYLRPARSRSNLTVLTCAQATRIVLESGRASAVVFRREESQEQARAKREVILCAGAINSPHLLLVSGIGPTDELEAVGVEPVHDLPDVGRNLQDHLAAGLLVASTGVKTLYSAESPLNLARFLLLGRGPLTSNVAEAVGLVRSQPELAAPDLELLFAPVLFSDEGLAPPQEDGFTVAAIALQPKSTGSVTLRTADALDLPLIDPRYLSDPEDLRVLVEGSRLARQIVAESPLSKYAREELAPGTGARGDEELAEQVRGRAQTLYHPIGTCRLGTVVDAELRVRGLDGLRVVDASVIPRIPRGHTNWPTVMVAEKAADLIRA